MRTTLVVLVFVLCLGVFGLSIHETCVLREGNDNAVGSRHEKPVIAVEEPTEISGDIPQSDDSTDTDRRSTTMLPETRQAARPPEFFEEPVVHQVQPEQQIVILEEEVEIITRDVPQGTSFDNLSQRNLDSTSCADAYGLRPVVKRPVVEP